MVQLQLRIFNRLSPGIRNLHPIEADAPEEWLGASGYEEGDRFLAQFLRHLRVRSDAPRRWILKSPEHVFSFDALTRVFPDAMLVLVHRDPGHVLVSAAP